MDSLAVDSINVRKTEDERFSVYDAIQFIAQKKNQRMVWKRLSEQYPEVVTNVTTCKFPGAGQRETPVADKTTIIEIIALLPGEVGGKTRKAAVELLLQYIEAPEELAKRAIAKINDADKLKEVHEDAFRKYINHYHPLMGKIKQRDGLSPTTYQHANTLNTKACMGAEPAIIKARRGGKTAREHATSEELSRLAVLQEAQCAGLKKVDARGHSEISGVIQNAADEFQLFLEKFGVV
ncbi:MAG: hypothetical protein ACRC62_37660 [Microcoleus sp.]